MAERWFPVVFVSAVLTAGPYLSQNQDIVDRVSRLESRVSPPVGTVVASLVPPTDFLRSGDDTWIHADGRHDVTDSAYFAITGRDRVPDLRGMFLRGLNTFDGGNLVDEEWRDPEMRTVGERQVDATWLPPTTTTTQSGEHRHTTGIESTPHTHTGSTNARTQGGGNTFDSGKTRGMTPRGIITIRPNKETHIHTIASSGPHRHDIEGGDVETRPNNVAVFYYVKIN